MSLRTGNDARVKYIERFDPKNTFSFLEKKKQGLGAVNKRRGAKRKRKKKEKGKAPIFLFLYIFL
jgi:hypothetical protein